MRPPAQGSCLWVAQSLLQITKRSQPLQRQLHASCQAAAEAASQAETPCTLSAGSPAQRVGRRCPGRARGAGSRCLQAAEAARAGGRRRGMKSLPEAAWHAGHVVQQKRHMGHVGQQRQPGWENVGEAGRRSWGGEKGVSSQQCTGGGQADALRAGRRRPARMQGAAVHPSGVRRQEEAAHLPGRCRTRRHPVWAGTQSNVELARVHTC